jgi:hypothetical protein
MPKPGLNNDVSAFGACASEFDNFRAGDIVISQRKFPAHKV